MSACKVVPPGPASKVRRPSFPPLRDALVSACPAFTLIEMILVMGIIIILATLVAPAASSILRGNDLTQGGQDLSGQLGVARQLALTQNRPVEFRIYQYVDPNDSTEAATNWKYRAVQTFTISETGAATPIGKVHALPNTVIIDSGSHLSTLIGNATAGSSTTTSGPILTAGGQTFNLPLVGKNYNYVAFRFLPDGSTNLPLPTTSAGGSDSNSWFITAHQQQYGDKLASPPSNFLTIQIEPFNGNTREFRP